MVGVANLLVQFGTMSWRDSDFADELPSADNEAKNVCKTLGSDTHRNPQIV
jgi:hypothetical protein